ncbi:MAG TPA: hypothetical protein VHS96_01825, partial [Bacteroidia bacterium]|nr:hypothetical protein [Bacteroidia bacterium]
MSDYRIGIKLNSYKADTIPRTSDAPMPNSARGGRSIGMWPEATASVKEATASIKEATASVGLPSAPNRDRGHQT